MTTEHVKISQVKTNAENPRTITKPKFQKLIDSILAFPAMLDIRPVVVDSRMAALGGNMRLNALKEIAKMSVEQLAERLYRLPEYQQANEGERRKLVEHWGAWLEKPVVPIINARHLTEHERRQFVIKDNVSYGAWDYDALANKWDSAKLEAWGMDVWTGNPVEFAPIAPKGAGNEAGHTDDGDPGPGTAAVDPLAGLEGALPPELQGRELTPDPLENLRGDDATPSDHIIITYSAEEREALAEYLGIEPEQLFSKICWRLDELQELLNNQEADTADEDETE